jgi:hypothetical protein
MLCCSSGSTRACSTASLALCDLLMPTRPTTVQPLLHTSAQPLPHTSAQPLPHTSAQPLPHTSAQARHHAHQPAMLPRHALPHCHDPNHYRLCTSFFRHLVPTATTASTHHSAAASDLRSLDPSHITQHCSYAPPRWSSPAGVFRLCRHPNYLGELLFWSGSWLAGLSAYASPQHWAASSLGLAGILSVMMSATKRLGAKQDSK